MRSELYVASLDWDVVLTNVHKTLIINIVEQEFHVDLIVLPTIGYAVVLGKDRLCFY